MPQTGLWLALTCLWMVGCSGAAVGDFLDFIKERGQAVASQGVIRRSKSLCDGERNYVEARKQIVQQSLNSLGIPCDTDSTPHIALLASGGGQRAAVGLVGMLHQLKTEGLLEALLYLGGVSGSTWSMATLYSDPVWSNNLEQALSQLFSPEVLLEEAMDWLVERAEDEQFSLTDVWGASTAAGFMKQLDRRRLSEEAYRNATNPYPIYCAIEKQCFDEGPTVGKWFEVSPHEAGFTELGLFIDTPLLGSKFRSGVLLEKKPEMDMIKIQGVLGCALAHANTIFYSLPVWMNVPAHTDAAAEEYLRAFETLDQLIDLIKTHVRDPVSLAQLENLQQRMQDTINEDNAALIEARTAEQRNRIHQGWIGKQWRAVERWGEELEEGNFKTRATVVIKRIIPLLMKWEWGTTYNFLHQYQDAAIPASLRSKEQFHLIDAGLLINVAYPSFLGDKRDIDLIIVPEYSSGHLFETLTLARDYAVSVGKPFPYIADTVGEDKDFPRGCYVYEGKDKEPTIIYMPLFNRDNCRDAEDLKARREEYTTFQLPFSPEKIAFVVETARANVRTNRDTLLREVRKAAMRRQRKSMAAKHRAAGLFGPVFGGTV